MHGRTRSAPAARGGQHAIPFRLRRRIGRRGDALFVFRPALPGATVAVPAVGRQIGAQRPRLFARQFGNAGQDVDHRLAVRAEQRAQRQRLQQFDRGGAPVAGLRHQSGHVAQLRHAHAPQLPGPAAAQRHGGNGLIDDQPGRLGARQADVVAGAFKRHVGIGGVEPETVAVGRGGRGSRHGRHYLSKASVQSIDPKRRPARERPPGIPPLGPRHCLGRRRLNPRRPVRAPGPPPAGCRPGTWRDTAPGPHAPARRPAGARPRRNRPGRC